MAIAFDTSTVSTASVVSSITFAFTANAALLNAILLVGVSTKAGTPANAVALSATYNGQSLTFLRADVDGGQRTEIWYKVAPTLGSSNNVVVTFTNLTDQIVAGAASFQGVNPDNPFMGNNGDHAASGTTEDVIVSVSGINGMAFGVVSVAGSIGSTLAPGTNYSTEIWEQLVSSTQNGGAAYGAIAPSGFVTFDYTFSASAAHTHSVCIMRPSVPPRNLGFNQNTMRPRIFGPGRAR